MVKKRKKNLPAMQETWVQSLGREYPLEKRMTTYSNILARRISGTVEPGGLLSMGLQRVRQDWATNSCATFSQRSPPHPTCQFSGKRLSSSGDSVWHAGHCLQRVVLRDGKPLHMWPALCLQEGKTHVRAIGSPFYLGPIKVSVWGTGLSIAQCQGN